jgi:hypothetical protein
MSEIATVPQTPFVAPVPAPFTERDAFELSLRKAKVLSASTLVPAQYQDNIPNCLIALNMARRIGADELMVMQNLHVVQGKPGWSGQFLIATFNNCGRFTSMKFEWRASEAKRPEWACRAYATELATGEKIIGSWVGWKMVEAEGWSKKAGSKWLTMPEQMFMYRSGAFLVRVYAPEIAMGLPTVEELRDVLPEIDISPDATSKSDAVTAALKAKLGPKQQPMPAPAELPPLTFDQVKAALEEALEGPPEAFALACEMIVGVPRREDQVLLETLANNIAMQRADREAKASE